MNFRHDCMKYTHLAIVVRRDPAEIQDLVDLALHGSVCLKKMISTGVFVLVVYELKTAAAKKRASLSASLVHSENAIF
jgi:hypothetical protein